MASATGTATAEPSGAPAVSPAPTLVDAAGARVSRAAPAPQEGLEPVRRQHRARHRLVSPLTWRILAVNVLALALLGGGFLYLGKYETSLIDQQIESLKTQGEVFAAALGEGAVLDSADEGEVLLPDLARQMMRRLVAPTKTRARLFDVKGEIVARQPGAARAGRGHPGVRTAAARP